MLLFSLHTHKIGTQQSCFADEEAEVREVNHFLKVTQPASEGSMHSPRPPDFSAAAVNSAELQEASLEGARETW